MFNFVIEMSTEKALSSCENSDMGICPYRVLSNLEYANDVMLINTDPSKLQAFLDRL